MVSVVSERRSRRASGSRPLRRVVPGRCAAAASASASTSGGCDAGRRCRTRTRSSRASASVGSSHSSDGSAVRSPVMSASTAVPTGRSSTRPCSVQRPEPTWGSSRSSRPSSTTPKTSTRLRSSSSTAFAVPRPSSSTTNDAWTRSPSSSGPVNGGGTKHDVTTTPLAATCGSVKSTNPNPRTCGRKVPVRLATAAGPEARADGARRRGRGAGSVIRFSSTGTAAHLDRATSRQALPGAVSAPPAATRSHDDRTARPADGRVRRPGRASGSSAGRLVAATTWLKHSYGAVSASRPGAPRRFSPLCGSRAAVGGRRAVLAQGNTSTPLCLDTERRLFAGGVRASGGR